MALPEQLLLSDLLRRRVRCDQGLDGGQGVLV
ncbi:MAG: RNA methyltransferase, partial [Cyanobium sp.]